MVWRTIISREVYQIYHVIIPLIVFKSIRPNHIYNFQVLSYIIVIHKQFQPAFMVFIIRTSKSFSFFIKEINTLEVLFDKIPTSTFCFCTNVFYQCLYIVWCRERGIRLCAYFEHVHILLRHKLSIYLSYLIELCHCICNIPKSISFWLFIKIAIFRRPPFASFYSFMGLFYCFPHVI